MKKIMIKGELKELLSCKVSLELKRKQTAFTLSFPKCYYCWRCCCKDSLIAFSRPSEDSITRQKFNLSFSL